MTNRWGLRAFRKVVYLPLDSRVQRDCDERVRASALPQVRWSLNATLTIHGLIEDSSAIQQEGYQEAIQQTAGQCDFLGI
jgi:hypothetical protein